MGHDLALPIDGAPTAAAVVLHPHPSMGGDRQHPVVVSVCEGLAVAGVAALRPDLTDPDVTASAAALEELGQLLSEVGVERLFLVGYSWGSVVASLAAPEGLAARVLVAPPVAIFDLPVPDTLPTLALVPAHDQYGGPEAVRAAVEGASTVTVDVVDGADHFLAGAVTRIADRTVSWLAALV